MKLKLIRKTRGSLSTIGELYINDKFICYTLEDPDRSLHSGMSIEEIKRIKVFGDTAIPKGTYIIDMNTISPRLSKYDFYKQYANGGRVPRLKNVPGFEGILMHTGNSPLDSCGCLLTGLSKGDNFVGQSREAFKKLYPLLQDSYNKGEEITIEII